MAAPSAPLNLSADATNETTAELRWNAPADDGGFAIDEYDVERSIDGGAFTASSFYQNGTAIAAGRASHTITIKVVSGTVRIDEFWAI